MKKYEIEINGEIYRVSVKELSEDTNMSTENSQALSKSNSETKDEPASKPVSQPTTGENTEVKAPMAGTILKINVSSGQSVSQGDTLVVLEAMKMENEIVAPADGTVSEIFVNPDERVESDQVLLKM